jgi:hypothetical protein
VSASGRFDDATRGVPDGLVSAASSAWLTVSPPPRARVDQRHRGGATVLVLPLLRQTACTMARLVTPLGLTRRRDASDEGDVVHVCLGREGVRGCTVGGA